MNNCVIDNIEFGVLSAKEIKEMSVVEIFSCKLEGEGSVYDPKLGPTVITKTNCMTCGLTARLCPGHFGHIVLAHPIFHPLYEKEIIKLLKYFCFSCFRSIQTDENSEKVSEKVYSICHFCNLKQPSWQLEEDTEAISSIRMVFDCDHIVECTSYDVLYMFQKYNKEDLEALGIYQPENLIIQILPILPPSTRPVVILDGNYCDDDLTIQYVEIIKINNTIKTKKENDIPHNELDKYIKILHFRIASLFNNSSGKSKHNTNGKVIKGIKERLSTKNGLMRENLMGKRVEQSARTVIGPDPTLGINEIAIPVEFANTLTISERVNDQNKAKLEQLIHSGKAKFIKRMNQNGEITEINLQYATKKRGTRLRNGDIIIRNNKEIHYDPKIKLEPKDFILRKKEDEELYDLIKVEPDTDKRIQLKIGDIVDRNLKDGDYVILNRQPTLHSGSMIGQKVKIIPGKTIRFNLCITKSLNADYDGDESNIHVPQNPNARIELEELSSVKNHILNQQSGNTNTVLVQDNLLSLYLMTYENTPIEREEFFDICMVLVDEQNQSWSWEKLTKKLNHLGISCRDEYIPSAQVISLCFPDSFTFECDTCVIQSGKWISGVFNKKVMTIIIKKVYHVFGEIITMMMINNLVFVSNQWLYSRGFSIGFEDCLTNSEQTLIPDTIMKCFVEANGLASQIRHAGIREARVQGALNKARDIGMKIAKEGLSANNNFLSTVHSGSKGDFFNIAQISGLLGQQNHSGKRVSSILNNGKRSLYHYEFELGEDKDIYESRGFVRHSFLRGLNPREQFFHAIAGREGIVSTALNTGTTGYSQRRLIKLMEDIHVSNDGTIRDENGLLYRFYYGEKGLDVLGVPKISDLVQQINTETELNV
jgi:DNA-directed RNA polymerase beta' subunit